MRRSVVLGTLERAHRLWLEPFLESLNYDLPTWPKTIESGHGCMNLRSGRYTRFSREKIQ